MLAWFQKRTSENVVLFDITPTSVAGSYVEITPGKAPTFFYTKRVEIPSGTAEDEEERLLVAFGILQDLLTKEGAPLKYRATHTGHIDSIIMCVGYPWQKTTIHTKTFNRGESFIFTEEMRDFALKEINAPTGMKLTGRFLLATLLNGYHIGNPIGKTVQRADLLMLSASVDAKLVETLEKVAKKHFHTATPRIVTFAPTVYFVLQDLYPHEEEVLIVNVSHHVTDIALVKKHLLVDVTEVPLGVGDCVVSNEKVDTIPSASTLRPQTQSGEWVTAITEAFKECASRQALPRTIFLLVEGEQHDFFKSLLDSKEIRSLWLSNTTLNILPLEEKHLSSFIRAEGDIEKDLPLSLLALFYTKHKALVP